MSIVVNLLTADALAGSDDTSIARGGVYARGAALVLSVLSVSLLASS
jgi:hypothetical protein